MGMAASKTGGAVRPEEPGEGTTEGPLENGPERLEGGAPCEGPGSRRPSSAHLPSGQATAAGEDALRAARRRYRDLCGFLADGYVVTDREGIILEANRAAAELLHVPEGELTGKPLGDHVTSADRDRLWEQAASLLRAGEVPPEEEDRVAGAAGAGAAVEIRLQPRGGPPLAVTVGVALAEAGQGGAGLRWLFRDISGRERLETERAHLLEELERQRKTVQTLAEDLGRDRDTLQSVMENSDACLAYLDRYLRLQRHNRAYAQQWGTDETELLASDRFQMDPDRQNRAVFEEVRQTGEALGLRARPCTRPGEGGRVTTYWDWRLVPVKDGSGQVRGLVLSLLDVTEEVRAAEEQSQAQTALYRQNEELLVLMRELDAFAHTVAHDLKQPLTIVMGFADMLNEEMAAGADDQEKMMLEGIKQGARRMNSIIEGLLLLASTRSSEVAPRLLNMGEIVREVIHALRLAATIDEARAELIVPPAWPNVVGYAPWVESVWANYLTNALKYGGLPPRIELGGEEMPGGYARFWVRDNGRGLTPEQQKRLFTSFTRLGQPRSLGHGLGLTIVRRIVERLGGEVGVESEPGKGSLFWFTLPSWEPPDA